MQENLSDIIKNKWLICTHLLVKRTVFCGFIIFVFNGFFNLKILYHFRTGFLFFAMFSRESVVVLWQINGLKLSALNILFWATFDLIEGLPGSTISFQHQFLPSLPCSSMSFVLLAAGRIPLENSCINTAKCITKYYKRQFEVQGIFGPG